MYFVQSTPFAHSLSDNRHRNRRHLRLTICVVLELAQPAPDVLKGNLFGDVVDQQGAYGTAVVGVGDCPVPLLPQKANVTHGTNTKSNRSKH